MNIGEALEAAKERRGIGNDTDAGAFFGIGQPAFSKWRRNLSTPEDFRADQIAEFVGLSRAEVLELLATARAERSARRTAPGPEPEPSPDASPSLQHQTELSTDLAEQLAELQASHADLHAGHKLAIQVQRRQEAAIQQLRREVERISRAVTP